MSGTPKNDARQLRKLHFDLANYFSNTIIPQMFVDADLILRIFTPPAMKQFSLSFDHVGSHIADVKDNLRYPHVVEDIEDVISSNSILEKEVQTTDGNWFQMNIIPYVEHEEKRINGVIITFVDITKRLLAQRELEKLNSQYETLMYALSHDIRQPISAMSLISEGLLIANKNNDTLQIEKLVSSLRGSINSLKSLVNDFTSGNEERTGEGMEQVSLNLEEICEDVVTALKLEVEEKKIHLSSNFKVSEIIFPRNSLRSVLYNLVHNAIKFSDPGKASEIKIATEKAGDFVILCVQDNGIGIAEANQRQVFKKSSRLSEDTNGTGMGLYVVKNLIENNEGRIKLESKEGEGTNIRVFFRVPV